MVNFKLRGAQDNDLPFIYSTWLRSYRYSSTGFSQAIDKDTYYEFHHRVIRRILDRGASILLSVDAQDPQVIYGYLIWEPLSESESVVHYAYVKKAFRQLGLFKAKIEAANLNPLSYTHQTSLGKMLSEKREVPCKYNPYLL